MDRIDLFELYAKAIIRSCMFHALPISWLFVLDPLLNHKYTGVFFWGLYVLLTVGGSFATWYMNRTTPEFIRGECIEVPTPIYGLITASFPFLIFLLVAFIYNMTY